MSAQAAENRRLGAGAILAVLLHVSLFSLAASRPERTLELLRSTSGFPELIEAPEPLAVEPGGAGLSAIEPAAAAEPAVPAVPTRAPRPRAAAFGRAPAPERAPVFNPAPEVLAADARASSLASSSPSQHFPGDSRSAQRAQFPGDSRAAQRAAASGAGLFGSGAGLFGSGGGTGRGDLKAKICRVPVTTRALRQIDACFVIYEQLLAEINVPPQRFDGGFPGFEDLMEYFAVDISGVFHVSDTGSYRFRLKSDDGSQLFIDDELVIDHDGVHGATAKIRDVDLSAGRHRIRVWYFQAMKYELALQLFVKPPSGPERLFSTRL